MASCNREQYSLMANSDAILTYNNNFNKFSLTVSVGGNYSYTNSTSLEATAGDLLLQPYLSLPTQRPALCLLPVGAMVI